MAHADELTPSPVPSVAQYPSAESNPRLDTVFILAHGPPQTVTPPTLALFLLPYTYESSDYEMPHTDLSKYRG